MITLLLTFFVLLISLAKMQDPEMIDASRDAFVNSIKYMGLGVVLGKDLTPNYVSVKEKYFIAQAESANQRRVINAREEDVRRMFEKVSESMKTKQSPLKTEAMNFSVMNIEFAAGKSELDSASQNFLKNYAENLQQTRSAGQIKLYIAAAAGDVSDTKQQYLLSAKRAHQVEAFLRKSLPAGFNCPIYSVGIGNRRDSGQGSQVLVAVLQNETN